MYLIVVFCLTLQSTCGFQFNNIEEQKLSNNVVPGIFPNARLPEQSLQNYGDCDKVAKLQKILLEIISALKNDIPTDANYIKNTESPRESMIDPYEGVNDKYGESDLQRLLDNLQKYDQNIDISRYIQDLNDRKENKPDKIQNLDLNLENELPAMKNAYCRKVLLGLMRTVYQTYVSLLRLGTCQNSGIPNRFLKTLDPSVALNPGSIVVPGDLGDISASIVDNNIPDIYNSNRYPIATNNLPDIYDYNKPNNLLKPIDEYQIPKNQNTELNVIYPSGNDFKPIQNSEAPNGNFYDKSPQFLPKNDYIPNFNSQPKSYPWGNRLTGNMYPFNSNQELSSPDMLNNQNMIQNLQHTKSLFNGAQRPDNQYNSINKQYPEWMISDYQSPNNFFDYTHYYPDQNMYNTNSLPLNNRFSPNNPFIESLTLNTNNNNNNEKLSVSPFSPRENAGNLNTVNYPISSDWTNFEEVNPVSTDPEIIKIIQPNQVKSNPMYADYYKNLNGPSLVVPPYNLSSIITVNGVPDPNDMRISSSTMRSNIVANENIPSLHGLRLTNTGSNNSKDTPGNRLYQSRDSLPNPYNSGPYISPSQNTFSHYNNLLGPKSDILTFIRNAIGYVYILIPVEKFDFSTKTAITLLKKILEHSNEAIINNGYFTVLELYKRIIDYIKTLRGYDELIDHMDLSRAPNRNELENQKFIELTYLVKQPVVYYPTYYVKYKLPYQEYLVARQQILPNKQSLRTNLNDLYEKLLVHSDVVETSPDIKNYKKEDLIDLTLKSGSLVNTKLIDGDVKVVEPMQVLAKNNSDIDNNNILESNRDLSNRIKFSTTNLRQSNVHDPNVLSDQVRGILTNKFYSKNKHPHFDDLNTGQFLENPQNLENYQVTDEEETKYDPAKVADSDITLVGYNSMLRNDNLKNEQNNSISHDYALPSRINILNDSNFKLNQFDNEFNARVVQKLNKATSKAVHLRDNDQLNYENLGGVYNIYEKKTTRNQPQMVYSSSSYTEDKGIPSNLYNIMNRSMDSRRELLNKENGNEDTIEDTHTDNSSVNIPNSVESFNYSQFDNYRLFNGTVNKPWLVYNNDRYNSSKLNDYQEIPSNAQYLKSIAMEPNKALDTVHENFSNENNSSETVVQESSPYTNSKDNHYGVYKMPMYSQYVQNIPM